MLQIQALSFSAYDRTCLKSNCACELSHSQIGVFERVKLISNSDFILW